ncbi:MAG TPA: phospholipase D-like domain-containing protein [Terriglobia bacterium]|nr:phospholipase D-like domain-containing protein [Terriglobia bacterium]
MSVDVLFTRSADVAGEIQSLIRSAAVSIDAALYRLSHPALVHALSEAAGRGVRVRLVLDRGKFQENRFVHGALPQSGIGFRLSDGRRTKASKMHHKFAVLDDEIVLTGSYNWTEESQEGNYENLIVLREPALAEAYIREFEALWQESAAVL